MQGRRSRCSLRVAARVALVVVLLWPCAAAAQQGRIPVAVPGRAPIATRPPVATSPPAGPAMPIRPAPPSRIPQPPIRGMSGVSPSTIGTAAFAWFGGGWNARAICFRSSLFGLTLFDPYWWLAPDATFDSLPATPIYTSGEASERPRGGLQLDVEPRRALVYVDGILAGTVDQFKGYFQHLETTAGYHVVEFISPDYEPFVAEVMVVPGQTTTFRAFLNRASGR
ncbi:MAG TPA: hypothetical protein VJP86_13545 [Vicinamibacterales bacterium]|nr:hypothetical protein [Vicinamibacterales bacterium]